MTTFIDFRYSQTLATAMFTGHEKEEETLRFSPGRDNYLVLEVRGNSAALPLATLDDAAGEAVASLHRDADGGFSLRAADGQVMVAVPAAAFVDAASPIVGLRLGSSVVGLRVGDTVREGPARGLAGRPEPWVFGHEDGDRVRVMGRGSGRSMRWAELHYHRATPAGLQVELAMDWHHLRAGIPWFGTMTAEELIAQGTFRLSFRSYAYSEAEARTTDFARLFGTDGPADIAVHLTPPLYAVPAHDVANLGFFVVESTKVQAELVRRCNRMDAICVPSRFAGETCRRAGVRRPIHVVPHGVDLDHFRPVPERRPLPGGRRFNFLAVCTHVERKNARHLVRAFLEEFREREDVALFLLLRPEYHTSQNNVALEFTEWERRHARDSAPIFLSTDYVSRDRLRDFYAHANAYVMPSNEGFGLTLLEAMACGTPVIGLAYGGVLDFLSDANGYPVPTGRAYTASDIDALPYVGDRYYAPDVGRLRAAMRHVVEHEAEARQRAMLARSECEARFGWDRVSRAFARVVDETHAIASRRPESVPRPGGEDTATRRVSWVLGVTDDEACAASLAYLKARSTGSTRVVCLFTRYARLEDVRRARELGFLFYRWDATIEHCRLIARSLLGPGWIGVLFPGERIAGDEAALEAFLAAQPPSVSEARVEVAGAGRDGRFHRIGGRGDGVQVFCPAVRIERTSATTRDATR